MKLNIYYSEDPDAINPPLHAQMSIVKPEKLDETIDTFGRDIKLDEGVFSTVKAVLLKHKKVGMIGPAGVVKLELLD